MTEPVVISPSIKNYSSLQPKKTKPCAYCKNNFIFARSSAKYCSSSCRKASNDERHNISVSCSGYLGKVCPSAKLTKAKKGRCRECEKVSGRFTRYPNSVLGSQVIATCKRAGTIETFVSTESVKQFETMCKLRSQSNTINKGKSEKEYNVCHKVPLNHRDVVGVSSDINLYLGMALANKQAGKKCGFHIENKRLSIRRSKLNPDYLVEKDTPQNEVMELLYRYLGQSFLEHVVDANYSARNTRSELDTDYTRYGVGIPDVIGASLMEYLGNDGYSDFDLAFEWACYESGYCRVTIDGEHEVSHVIADIGPWVQIQKYLQTDDVFDCEGFVFGYEPKCKPEPDDVW
jgi:hypothetical protein